MSIRCGGSDAVKALKSAWTFKTEDQDQEDAENVEHSEDQGQEAQALAAFCAAVTAVCAKTNANDARSTNAPKRKYAKKIANKQAANSTRKPEQHRQ